MKKVMLITPMLHQGGFERICVMTARLLQKKCEVVIVVFSMEDIAFDISGLSVIDLKLAARAGKLGKGRKQASRDCSRQLWGKEKDSGMSFL